MNHRTLINELQIKVKHVVANNTINARPETAKPVPELDEYRSLILREAILVPANNSNVVDPSVVFIYEPDAKDSS